MTKYNWKNKWTYITKRIRNSIAVRQKLGHSTKIGAGFIRDELVDVTATVDGEFIIQFINGSKLQTAISNLNICECNELLNFCEIQELKKKLVKKNDEV